MKTGNYKNSFKILFKSFDVKRRNHRIWEALQLFEIHNCILRKQDTNYLHYENTPIQIYWKFYNQKRENFPIKNSDIFQISAQNIDCGYSLEPPRRGGSNEYPQSMFWAEIRIIMYTPVNPSFTI